MFENIARGATTGLASGAEIEALQKALTAGYGTDMSTLAGGSALRVQSLDPVMQTTIQENSQFVLFNRLMKTKPKNTVDEWTEQNSVGGFLGGTSNSETGIIQQATGNYNRRVGMVKYMMTMRQVSLVLTLQDAIADAESVEFANGALQLLTDVEHFLYEGDESVNPLEFSGIKAQILAGVATGDVDTNNVIDMDGAAFKSMEPINAASAQARRYGNFGTSTDVFFNQDVQKDFDNNIDPAFRVALNQMGGAEGGLRLGAPVIGVRTSGGPVKCNEDIFIRDETMKMAFELIQPVYAAQQIGIKPSSLTTDNAATSPSTSRFTATRSGTYVYGVAGVNSAGASPVQLTSQIAVGQGKAVTLSIGASAGRQETGYIIYRGTQNGPAAVSDLREICRIPAGGATVTFVDDNTQIPGSTEAYILNMKPGATAITWRQLLPMLKFQLYPTNSAVLPWAQMLFGFLRISKRKHHIIVRNIITTDQQWRPFTNE